MPSVVDMFKEFKDNLKKIKSQLNCQDNQTYQQSYKVVLKNAEQKLSDYAEQLSQQAESFKTWLDRFADRVQESAATKWLDKVAPKEGPSLAERAVDAAKNSGWIR